MFPAIFRLPIRQMLLDHLDEFADHRLEVPWVQRFKPVEYPAEDVILVGPGLRLVAQEHLIESLDRRASEAFPPNRNKVIEGAVKTALFGVPLQTVIECRTAEAEVTRHAVDRALAEYHKNPQKELRFDAPGNLYQGICQMPLQHGVLGLQVANVVANSLDPALDSVESVIEVAAKCLLAWVGEASAVDPIRELGEQRFRRRFSHGPSV
ncbi:MAG TPA: hypothetical protein PKJ98_20845 [Verrucomicrobiota bacterium]|nr:hypothetical protein [Verrucomicrobiota bacterium]